MTERVACIWLALALTATELHASRPEGQAMPHGPVYVPLDSWIYPALKRLAAMGYAPDEESLAAPWTREQCEILVREAEDIASRRSTRLEARGLNNEALTILGALKQEFPRQSEPGAHVRIDSVYTNITQISGPPLRDSYHFGQTIINNYGRPYAQGTNTTLGFSASGVLGRFSGYFRGEYQSAGSTAPYSANVRDFIANADQIPIQPSVRSPTVNRFDPVEFYVGAQLGDLEVTAGKQAQWWGPGESSAYSFSNNAEPLYGIRISQSLPFLLPGPLRWLGRVRTQFLLGRFSGHEFPPKPFLNAQKITFQVTRNLEFGFTRSAIFGGVGHPLTTDSFLRSFFSLSSTPASSFGSSDPGDRRSGFDFRWRLPGLRRFVTIYSDSLADDDPSPLASPHRSAWAPGVYITKLPGLEKLDFRFETFSTWLYRKDEGGQFIYWNDEYHDAYTNDGNVVGSWVGRDARAYMAATTYWWSARNKITASYRQTKTSSKFVPGGGTQTDLSLSAQWSMGSQLLASAYIQAERYYIPLFGSPRHDVVSGAQLTFYPKDWTVKH